jgi:hypothetical protein
MAEPPKKDAPAGGMATEEMVRKLMQMNPHLRGDGQSTKDVMSVLSKSQSMGAGQATAKPAPVTPTAAPNLSVELARLREAYQVALHDFDKDEAALKTLAQDLEKQKKALGGKACEQVIVALLKLDPNLTQRKHQVMLEKEKAFLDSIGFTPAKLIAAERERERKRT